MPLLRSTWQWLYLPLPRDQCNQLQKILCAKVRPRRGQRRVRALRRNACPARWQMSQRAGAVIEIDAIFPPSLALIDQCELLPVERVEGMRDPKDLRLFGQLGCS